MTVTYYITARKQLSAGADSAAPEEAVKGKIREAFSAGVDYVQVREKDLSGRSLAQLVTDVASLRERANTRLLVNDRIDVALSCGADGVHIPSGAMPLAAARQLVGETRIVGLSCHNEDEAVAASEAGASYILLAPIFATPSKPDARPLGLPLLEKICVRVSVPVFALGGVDASNAESCIRAGASGVAGIRLFQHATDLPQLCRYLRSLGD
ncbi:MAG: thiamine phosphate synthase [Acidobacteria bacterium]|nr:thiamine phosphate synthase [Acidobacteriota bacterium]